MGSLKLECGYPSHVQNSTHRVSIAKAAQSAVALMTKRLGLASGGAPGEGARHWE